MSTKIHHGYRLAAGTRLWEFLTALRATLNPIRDRLDAALLAEDCAAIIDWAQFDLARNTDETITDSGPVFQAWLAYEARQGKLKSSDHRHDPNRFNMSIGWDEPTRRHLLLVYSEQKALVEAFTAMPAVEEYSYWDNSDRPGTQTRNSWDERGATWKRIMPIGTVPADTMLTFELRPTPNVSAEVVGWGTGDRQMILDQMPTPQRRARVVLRHALINALRPQTLNAGDFSELTRVVQTADRLAAEHAEALTDHIAPIGPGALDKPFSPDAAASKSAQTALEAMVRRLVDSLAAPQEAAK